MKELSNLIEIVEMAFEYIDAIPEPIELPAMPGFDRDEANAILDSAKTKLKNLGEGEAGTGYALLADVPKCEAERYMFGKVLFQRLNKDSLWYAVYNNQIIDWDRYSSDLEERLRHFR